MKLIFITGNKGKFEEAKQLFPEIEQNDIDLDEIQGIDPKVIIAHKLAEAKKNNGWLDCGRGHLALFGLFKWIARAVNKMVYENYWK